MLKMRISGLGISLSKYIIEISVTYAKIYLHINIFIKKFQFFLAFLIYIDSNIILLQIIYQKIIKHYRDCFCFAASNAALGPSSILRCSADISCSFVAFSYSIA